MIELNKFILEEFDLNNDVHNKLKQNLINSTNSELISKDIDGFIKRNNELHKQDNITNSYVVNYNNVLIGISFVNYHPEIIRNNEVLKEEIEIGLGLLDEYRG